MTTRTRGADALVRAMQNAGVTRLFTLSGNHIMSVFDAALDAGITLVHTRHEAAAVFMADAWGRLTGEPGVALVTGGPGHANAVGALYTAAMSESPVVLLSGHAPASQLGTGAFQEMRQADIAAPLTKLAMTSTRADAIAGDFATAMRTARSGRRGPVHLSLPSDCLDGDADPAHVPGADAFAADAIALDEASADAMLARLRNAKRPLIVTGPMLMTRAGRAAAMRLQEATGIMVIGMESPRGLSDASLGGFAQMLAQADCVLLFAKRLDYTLKFGKPPALAATCEILQIDADDEQLERSRRAAGARLIAAVRAEPFAAADMLARRARATSTNGWFGEVSAALAARPAGWDSARSGQPGRLHPLEALRPLQAIIDRHPESVLVMDGGEFSQWAQALLNAPNRVTNGVAGAIGPGLPFGVAARIAQPAAPVIVTMGDGTFGFHPAEIDTAVRARAPFVAIVGNDARWNAEYQIQLRDYGANRVGGCELLPTRYDNVAIAFGGYGEHVTRADEVAPAVERAMASGLPAVINVALDGQPAPSFEPMKTA
ncbi:MAG TPA: thiamine pyrophosphate-binding protein [Xanthobacteraceae bacterium]|nr:thiamine pyrophosphate-binding protein [Xanthobacteraceae bacterium]